MKDTCTDRDCPGLVAGFRFILHEMSRTDYWPDVLQALSPYALQRLEEITDRVEAWPYPVGDLPLEGS